jgi:hypothetical protein
MHSGYGSLFGFAVELARLSHRDSCVIDPLSSDDRGPGPKGFAKKGVFGPLIRKETGCGMIHEILFDASILPLIECKRALALLEV